MANNQTYKTYLKSFEELREKVDQLDLKSTAVVETVNIPIPTSTDPGTADTQYSIDLSGLSFPLFKYIEYVFRLQNSAQDEGVDIKVADNNTGTSSFTVNNTTVELSGDGNIDASANPWYAKLDIDNQILFIRSPNINQIYLEAGNIYEIIISASVIALQEGIIQGIQNDALLTKVEFTLDAEDLTGTDIESKTDNAFLRKEQIITLVNANDTSRLDIVVDNDGNEVIQPSTGFLSTVDGVNKLDLTDKAQATQITRIDGEVGNPIDYLTSPITANNAISATIENRALMGELDPIITGSTLMAKIISVNQNIGDLTILPSVDKTNTVAAINENWNRVTVLNEKVGDLLDLDPEFEDDERLSTINAINAVNQRQIAGQLENIENNIDGDLEVNAKLLDITGVDLENKDGNEYITKDNILERIDSELNTGETILLLRSINNYDVGSSGFIIFDDEIVQNSTYVNAFTGSNFAFQNASIGKRFQINTTFSLFGGSSGITVVGPDASGTIGYDESNPFASWFFKYRISGGVAPSMDAGGTISLSRTVEVLNTSVSGKNKTYQIETNVPFYISVFFTSAFINAYSGSTIEIIYLGEI